MSGLFTWSALFQAGGPTLIVLLICFLVAAIVIVERWLYFRGRFFDPSVLSTVLDLIRGGDSSNAGRVLLDQKSPAGYVLFECLQTSDLKDEQLFEEVKARAIAEKIPEMERYLNLLATLGSVSPFIGLLGTVLGIIRAFMSLGQTDAAAGAAGGLSGLNAGIAESLVATAAGLLVAIPATAAFNYFRKRVNDMITSIEIAASRFKVSVRKGRH